MENQATTASSGNQEVLLRMEEINKEFPGVKALGSCIADGQSRDCPRTYGGEWRRKINTDEVPVWRI